MTCRICYDEDDIENLLQPCHCSGTTAHVHNECLVKWLIVSNRTDCEICHFEYDVIEVEESTDVCCPPCSLSGSMDMSAAVITIGLIGHIVIMFFTTFWGTTTEDMFFYGNILQVFMMLILHPNIHHRQVIVFWKVCSTICLVMASVVQDEWRYLFFEGTATVILALHMYAHLVRGHKQLVRYINIHDQPVNDPVETVQGP